MFSFLIKTKNFFLEILFPKICLHCHQGLQSSEDFLCADCLQKIQINNALFCPICRKRLPDSKNLYCHNKAPKFLLAAAGNYDDDILRNLIHYFKYRKISALGSLLGKILFKYIKGIENLKIDSSFIIIPISLHFWRKKSRGFNQAEILGEYMAQELKLEFFDCLKRIKNNPAQAKLNIKERKENIKGCFQMKKNFATIIAGKNILLIDDVFTSGATLTEAVKILRENGCRKIIALTLAKT